MIEESYLGNSLLKRADVQHNFTKELSGKINLLDRFITFIFLKFLKL